MKIIVKSSDHNIRLWIPNSLILSDFTRHIMISKIIKLSNGNIPFPPVVMNELLINLKEISKEYKGLNIVEVEANDGTEVLICL